MVCLENRYGYNCLTADLTPTDKPARIEITLQYEKDSREFGVFLPIADDEGQGYCLRIIPDEHKALFTCHPYNNWSIDQINMKGLERPITLAPEEPVKIVLLLDKTTGVFYINDKVALSARMYRKRKESIGIYTIHGAVKAGCFTKYSIK